MPFHNQGSILSTIKHYNVHTTFYHSIGLTRKLNLMFNGNIYYVLYLLILCFHLVRQSIENEMTKNMIFKNF